jgi:hypothetical protein
MYRSDSRSNARRFGPTGPPVAKLSQFGRHPLRRFDDLRVFAEQGPPEGVDEEDLRWFLLRREIVARCAREAWRRAGAPARRAGDRP